jgi:hypothetical protein
MSEQNASARRGSLTPPKPTTEGLPGHLEPQPLHSRRSFLERVPALVAFPAWAGSASELRGEVQADSTATQVLPCTRCAPCMARFCRYKVGGNHTVGP